MAANHTQDQPHDQPQNPNYMINQEGKEVPRPRWASLRGTGRSLQAVAVSALLLGSLFYGLLWSDDAYAAFSATPLFSIHPPATPDWSETGPPLSGYAFSTSAAGDVNNDGYGDLLVGSYLDSSAGTSAGKVYLYYGSPTGLQSTDAFSVTGEREGDFFGRTVANAGDVDNDTIDDFIIGAESADLDDGRTNVGKVYVYSGQGGGLEPTLIFTATGEGEDDNYGAAIAGAGDVDNNGYADILIGAYEYPGQGDRFGRVYLHTSGLAGISPTPVFTATGEFPNDGFGRSVNTAGDVNGDGYADIIIGAWQYDDGPNSDAGKVYVYHGGPGGPDTTPDFTATGPISDTEFGIAVSTAGDVNYDGYDDVIVGAYRYDEGSVEDLGSYRQDVGRIYVYYGSPTGLLPTPGFVATGEEIDDQYGFAVNTAGDVNGDGFSDLLVGAYLHDTEIGDAVVQDAGKIYLYAGCYGGILPTAIFTATGDSPNQRFGISLDTAGNVNGDFDAITGKPYDDIAIGTVAALGKATVYHGAAGGCRPELVITQTVGYDSVNPVCGSDPLTDTLHVPVSTTVTYCYEVHNTGNLTLTHHTIEDDALGTLLSSAPVTLTPGASYTYRVTNLITADTVNTTTWTGVLSITTPSGAPTNPPNRVLSATGQATATVTVATAEDDSDNDSIPDNVESADDSDGDGIPNHLDDDSDGDGHFDKDEAGSDPNNPEDKDNNGMPGYLDPAEGPLGIGGVYLPRVVR